MELVSKGVVERFIESQSDARTEVHERDVDEEDLDDDEREAILAKVWKAIAAGKMTREEAGEVLGLPGMLGDSPNSDLS